MADRVVMIEGGRLVAETTLYELLSGSGPVVDVRTPKPERLTAALDARNMHWSGEGDRILIQGASVEAVGEVAANAGVVVMAVVATLAMFALGDQRGLPPDSDETLRNAMHAAGAGSTFVIVSGIIGMAGEFRFGQADQTFLTTPSRGMVVAAKTLVYSVLGLLFGAVAALATALTGQIWLSQQGLVLPLERPEVWLTLVGAIASGALYGALGVGIGAVTRNQVVAIVATLASLLVLEPTLFMAADSVVRWLPGAAGQALRRDPADGLVSMGWGAVVLGSYVLTAVILGTRRIVRSDVT